MSTLVALQPCFDRDERVRAYAVGYRTRLPLELSDTADPAAASLKAVLDALFAEGVARVTGGQPGLLRVPRHQLADPQLRRLDPGAMLLLVDGTNDPASGLAAFAARPLADAGYGLVLEVPADGGVSAALLEWSRYLLVDVAGAPAARVSARIAALRTLGLPIIVRNAPPLSTSAEWEAAGASLVQWAALAASPKRVEQAGKGINDANALRLLGSLRDPKVHDAVLEEGFTRDLALSYELLKLVNSAAVTGREIYSIGHAIRLLGRDVIYQRLASLVLRSLGDRGVRAELSHRALVRGRFAEQMADEVGIPKAAGPLFTVGFLSALPDLLGVPKYDLGRHVPLAPDVRSAIEHHADFYGSMLALVEAWEAERWDGVLVRCAAEGISPDGLASRYLRAVSWARTQMTGPMAAAA